MMLNRPAIKSKLGGTSTAQVEMQQGPAGFSSKGGRAAGSCRVQQQRWACGRVLQASAANGDARSPQCWEPWCLQTS
jgi:hypothetical protein